ncbi:Zn-ribbon domain-containing OB-fold protein [Kitasatospora sp. NPDC094028]
MVHSVIDADSSCTTLYFQRCAWCGNPTFQRLLCPTCGSTDLRLEPSEGTGVVRRCEVEQARTPLVRQKSLIRMAEGFDVWCIVGGLRSTVPVGTRVRLEPVEGDQSELRLLPVEEARPSPDTEPRPLPPVQGGFTQHLAAFAD